MPDVADEIATLLRRAQAADPAVSEFAWLWLDSFRRDAAEILILQRREMRRSRAPDRARARLRAERRLDRARLRLLARLRRLMRWAGQSGRGGSAGPGAEA